jgi:hypothetical protein
MQIETHLASPHCPSFLGREGLSKCMTSSSTFLAPELSILWRCCTRQPQIPSTLKHTACNACCILSPCITWFSKKGHKSCDIGRKTDISEPTVASDHQHRLHLQTDTNELLLKQNIFTCNCGTGSERLDATTS